MITKQAAYDLCKDMVYKIANSFSGSDVPIEDITQSGMVGLMEAVEKYDNRRKVKFSTFARYYIYRHAYDEAINHNAVITKKSTRGIPTQMFHEYFDELIASDVTVEDSIVHKRTAELLKRKLKRFDAKTRNIFILRHGLFDNKQLSARQLAKRYNYSVQTIQTKLKEVIDFIKKNVNIKDVEFILDL